MVDPVTDRLADRNVHTGDDRHPVTQLGHDIPDFPLREVELDVDLGGVDALRMLVELSPAGPPRGRDHRRMRQQHLLDAPPQLI